MTPLTIFGAAVAAYALARLGNLVLAVRVARIEEPERRDRLAARLFRLRIASEGALLVVALLAVAIGLARR